MTKKALPYAEPDVHLINGVEIDDAEFNRLFDEAEKTILNPKSLESFLKAYEFLCNNSTDMSPDNLVRETENRMLRLLRLIPSNEVFLEPSVYRDLRLIQESIPNKSLSLSTIIKELLAEVKTLRDENEYLEKNLHAQE